MTNTKEPLRSSYGIDESDQRHWKLTIPGLPHHVQEVHVTEVVTYAKKIKVRKGR